jgi:hypothetical protein
MTSILHEQPCSTLRNTSKGDFYDFGVRYLKEWDSLFSCLSYTSLLQVVETLKDDSLLVSVAKESRVRG